MQRRKPGGLGGMPQREHCVRAGTQLSGPNEPRPVLDGVIWGDGSQHLPFFKTKPASCTSKIVAFKVNHESVSLNWWTFHAHDFVSELPCATGVGTVDYWVVRPRFTSLANRFKKNDGCFSQRWLIPSHGFCCPCLPKREGDCSLAHKHTHAICVQCLNFSSSVKYEIILKWHIFQYSNKNQSGKENYMMQIILRAYKSAVKSFETPECLGSLSAVQNNYQLG